MSDIVELKVPSLGESVVEATVARWHKKVGEAVQMDELLVELETDKVTLEVAAPRAGVIKAIISPQGAVVNVGAILGEINTSDVATLVTTPATTQPSAQVELTPTTAMTPSAPASFSYPDSSLPPSVRKLVAEKNIDPNTLQGHGKGNRITKGDVLGYTAHNNAPQNERLENRVPMSRLRQRIAERLKMAQNSAAILTTFNEVDMTAINGLRQKYKDSFEKKYGAKLGFMSFFIKACVHALQQIPMINSRIEEQEIVTCNYIDIGVAVSAPQGLVVPVIRDADLMSMAAIELAVAEFGKKARDGKLTIDEMSGGTFSISNGGVFGSLLSTPIINPPQSAILGMHKIQDRPVAIDGRIEIRPMMYLALSYDHRLVDGREAVTFLVQIKDSLENPGRFLLEI